MTRQLVGHGLSIDADTPQAVREACRQALEPLEGNRVTLAAVFATPSHWLDSDALARLICAELNADHVIGSMSEAVIARGRELEQGPGVAVLAAHLPGAIVTTRHLRVARSGDGFEIVGAKPPSRTGQARTPAIVMSDPFSMDAERLIRELGDDGYVTVGGLCSGGRVPGAHRLLVDERVVTGGAVIATIDGIRTRTLVSQGCAPIGPEMVVTDATREVVHSLAGRPAFDRLQEVIAALSPEERALAAGGLLAGLVINENRPEYGRGDYLMRAVLGADRESRNVSIGERARVGQTLRFHVRDAASAADDLRQALEACHEDGLAMSGGLLFSCNGRGQQLFGDPDHDATLAERVLGPIPVAGMFCNGEIGPVGQRNFLHGFTATMLLFEEVTSL